MQLAQTRTRHRVQCSLVAAVFAAMAFAANATPQAGWHEAVVSVQDIERASEFFIAVARWEVLADGPFDQRLLDYTINNEVCTCRERLLGKPGDVSGHLRLIEINPERSKPIRSSARLWEPGAFGGVNVRVADIQEIFDKMQRMGWHGYSDPVEFDLGTFSVSESILQGPDGLTIGLIQRLSPPLSGFGSIEPVSRAFNAYQTVADFDASLRFYKEVLGFQTYLKADGPLGKDGQNIFGLPFNHVSTTSRRLEWLQPAGGNEGSIAIMNFPTLEGRQFNARARLSNFGLVALRYKSPSAAQRCEALAKSANTALVEDAHIAPQGSSDLCRVSTPDGGYIEFVSTAASSR